MSKYGPAWVWLATGQSLGQVTPSSTLLRRGCQPQSATSIHAILAVLHNSVTGNRNRGGMRPGPGQRKGRRWECFELLNQGFAPKCSGVASSWKMETDNSTDHQTQMPMPPKGSSCTPGKLRLRWERDNLPKDSGQGGGQWQAREQSSKGGWKSASAP